MNNSIAIHPARSFARTRRFLRNPKGLLIAVLGGFAAIAMVMHGARLLGPGLVAAILAAVLVDSPILRWRKKKWVFPDGALLTGLIVAMILSPQAPWRVAALASAVAVGSKYLLRARTANIFNPAALGLVVAYLVFHSGQSWWGALPDLSPPSLEPGVIALLLIAGGWVADRVQRLPAALAFLGVHYLLFTLTAFFGDPGRVVAIFRSSDLHAALFCALFMVTDPPTSPAKSRDQILFGVLAAVASYAVSQLVGAVIFLLAGVLVANGWEAVRRARARAVRRVP